MHFIKNVKAKLKNAFTFSNFAFTYDLILLNGINIRPR